MPSPNIFLAHWAQEASHDGRADPDDRATGPALRDLRRGRVLRLRSARLRAGATVRVVVLLRRAPGAKMKKGPAILIAILLACGVIYFIFPRHDGSPKIPDLPKRPDKWVDTIRLKNDSKAKYVGKTLVLGISTIKELQGLHTISVGDDINGVKINAIKCRFFVSDAGYANELLSKAAAPPGAARGAREFELYDASFDATWELDFFGRVRPISNDLRNPETRHANLTLSRQIGANFVLDLGYTGVFGFGLFGERDTNFPTVKPDPRHPGFFYFGPRPDPRFAAVRTNENSRTSHYESFFAHAEKRLSHHFQFQAGYTLSKLISSTEDFTSRPSDPRNIRAERALALNDTRHQVNFSVVYDTAQLSDIRLIKHIVNNWTIGLIGQLQSARPYTVETGDAPFVGLLTQQRPNVLPDGTLVSTNIAGISQTN